MYIVCEGGGEVVVPSRGEKLICCPSATGETARLWTPSGSPFLTSHQNGLSLFCNSPHCALWSVYMLNS